MTPFEKAWLLLKEISDEERRAAARGEVPPRLGGGERGPVDTGPRGEPRLRELRAGGELPVVTGKRALEEESRMYEDPPSGSTVPEVWEEHFDLPEHSKWRQRVRIHGADPRGDGDVGDIYSTPLPQHLRENPEAQEEMRERLATHPHHQIGRGPPPKPAPSGGETDYRLVEGAPMSKQEFLRKYGAQWDLWDNSPDIEPESEMAKVFARQAQERQGKEMRIIDGARTSKDEFTRGMRGKSPDEIKEMWKKWDAAKHQQPERETRRIGERPTAERQKGRKQLQPASLGASGLKEMALEEARRQHKEKMQALDEKHQTSMDRATALLDEARKRNPE